MTESVDNPIAAIMARVEATMRRRAEERLRVLDQDCPRCVDPRSEVARQCAMRFEEAEDGQSCRWAQWKRDKDSEEERRSRRGRYRIGRPDWTELIIVGSEPPALAPALFTSPEDRQAQQLAREDVQRFLKGSTRQVLMLTGSPGTGKSFLAAWVAVRSPSCLWIECTRANTFESWRPIEGSIDQHSRCIVFDDLGFESDQPAVRASISGAIARAINQGARVIITTNLSLDDLAPRYDPRVHSRLVECALGVDLGSTDLRVAMRKGA